MVATRAWLVFATAQVIAAQTALNETLVLMQNRDFIEAISVARPLLQHDNLLRLTHKQPYHHIKAKTAIEPNLTRLTGLTDHIPDAVFNGFLNRQQWRNFTSPVGKPGSRGQGNVIIQYLTARGPGKRGAVVLSLGLTATVAFYAEFIYELIEEGYSPIYALENRGHGRSTRLLQDTLLAHVEERTDYVADFRKFVDIATAELDTHPTGSHTIGKRYLFTLSMGSMIAFQYLIEDYYAQRPNKFNAVVAQAPQFFFDPNPLSFEATAFSNKALVALGLAARPGLGLGDATLDSRYGEMGSLSPENPDRIRLTGQLCLDRRDVKYPAGHVGLCLTVPTIGWFAAAVDAAYEVFARLRGTLSIPILIQQAGELPGRDSDGLVLHSAHRDLCFKRASNCKITPYPGASHAMMQERDFLRDKMLKEMFEFWDRNAGSRRTQDSLPITCDPKMISCIAGGCECVYPCTHPAASCTLDRFG